MVVKFSFMITISPSLIQVTFVGGDPEEEQFREKTEAELSCSDVILIGAIEIMT